MFDNWLSWILPSGNDQACAVVLITASLFDWFRNMLNMILSTVMIPRLKWTPVRGNWFPNINYIWSDFIEIKRQRLKSGVVSDVTWKILLFMWLHRFFCPSSKLNWYLLLFLLISKCWLTAWSLFLWCVFAAVFTPQVKAHSVVSECFMCVCEHLCSCASVAFCWFTCCEVGYSLVTVVI